MHQLGPSSVLRDGTVDVMLAVEKILTELGFSTKTFVGGDIRSAPHLVHPASELRPRAHDLLLVHHRGPQDRLDWLASLRCRKVLAHHGIGASGRSAAAGQRHLVSQAFAQLAELRGMVEASIAFNDMAAVELRRRGFGEVTTIELARDWTALRSVEPIAPIVSNDGRGFSLVSVAPITDGNHQRHLIRLIGEARAATTLPLNLTLIGAGQPDPEYRAAVEHDIRRMGLADRVALVDAADEAAMAWHYRSANAFISLAEHPDASGPMLAAMALDLPVIAYAPPRLAPLLENVCVVLPDRSAVSILDAVYQLHQGRAFRREVIRRQRDYVGVRDGRQNIETLGRWLSSRGVQDTRLLFGLVPGWIGSRAARFARKAPASRAPIPGREILADGRRYIVESARGLPAGQMMQPLAQALDGLSEPAGAAPATAAGAGRA
ncbi:MAG TPA: glycosyltransferase, partial [Stellaceae bacterium]|nr:glycosyltransferase [Stellaceae bacterium]